MAECAHRAHRCQRADVRCQMPFQPDPPGPAFLPSAIAFIIRAPPSPSGLSHVHQPLAPSIAPSARR
jgi:hypothetical protein